MARDHQSGKAAFGERGVAGLDRELRHLLGRADLGEQAGAVTEQRG